MVLFCKSSDEILMYNNYALITLANLDTVNFQVLVGTTFTLCLLIETLEDLEF